MGNYLFFLLILACPLMMVFMMRGMHGGNAAGGHSHGHTTDDGRAHEDTNSSLEELRRERELLDHEIERRETYEETPTPVGGGWR